MKRPNNLTGKDVRTRKNKPRRHSSGSSAKNSKNSGRSQPNLTIRLDRDQELCHLEQELTALKSSRDELRDQLAGLKRSRDYYSSLFDSSPVGYVTLDELGCIKGLNLAFASIMHLEHQYTKRPMNSFLTKESLPDFLDHLRELKKRFKPARVEVALRTREGKVLPVELLSTPIRTGSCLEIRTVVINIGPRLEMQQKLAESQRDFGALVESIDGLVWEVDATNFRLTFVSGSAERLLGYPVESWYNAGTWPAFAHVEDRERVLDVLARLLVEPEKRATVEYRFVAHDRRVVWVRDVVTLRQTNGKSKICGVAIDITDKKLAEHRLVEAHDLL